MSPNKFFRLLVPKEKKFFPLFDSFGDVLVEAANELCSLLKTSTQEERDIISARIKALENQGDSIAHNIYFELNKTFITPFDREDIHNLISSLDEVLDNINSASQSMQLYRPLIIEPQYLQIAGLVLEASREVQTALTGLTNLKHPQKISDACIKINSIENQADDIYHQYLSELFSNEKNAIELIKKKAVMDFMELATDMAEDVSDVIKSILVKTA